jgi:glycosyltransferase involved in cell wall biosynthesis
MPKVLHVISGLKVGGAEMMLHRLIVSARGGKYEHQVVSLEPLGEMRKRFEEAGIVLFVFDFKHSPIAHFFCLVSLIRRIKPDIMQSWLYHADLLGGLAARLAGSCFVVWNIRSTAIPQGALSITFWLVRLCAILSYFIPDRTICCANSAKTAHIKLRYAARKMTVIPNGYDFSDYEFDLNSRARVRLELGFDDTDMVIGVVGRFDPLKDFHNFVSAASYMAAKCGNVKFLMVGRGNEWSNPTLRGWIEKAGLVKSFHLAGQRTNVAYFLSAMDIFCLSSVNEAFPNVVVEAMAIGLPCVVTQAGDAADILGDDGFVVSVKDPILLADALIRMYHLDPVDRRLLGERNAKKVRLEYGIEKIRRNYEAIYDEVSRK